MKFFEVKKMDDIEGMKKYCLAPCFVVKRLSTDEVKEHKEYIYTSGGAGRR